MTKEEYLERVREAAVTLLTETEAQAWKKENEDQPFYEFADAVDLPDQLHSLIDSTCESTWQGAIEVLNHSDQDPDHVDSGIYEGCSWKKILIILAFEVYSWDVSGLAEEMFNNDEFEEYLMPLESNQRQIGHFPDIQRYKIPKGAWAVNLHSGIKVMEETRRCFPKAPLGFSVVFEGETEERPSHFIVYAKRVYTQGGDDSNIQQDLERCQEEYGVRILP